MDNSSNYLCCLKLRTCVTLITIVNQIYFTTFTVGYIICVWKPISFQKAPTETNKIFGIGILDYIKIMSAAGLILLLFLVLYVNTNLMKATKKFNVLHIKQWLMFHSIIFMLWTTVLVYWINVLNPFNLSLLMFIQAIFFFLASFYEMNTVLRFYYSEKFDAVTSTGDSLGVLFQQFSDEEISETDETTTLETTHNRAVLTGGEREQVP